MCTTEMCLQPVEPDDGMTFDPDSVAGEFIMEEEDYEGVRIRFKGYLGKVEIGFGVLMIGLLFFV